MLISIAHASSDAAATTATTSAGGLVPANLLMIVFMVAMFYVLLIRPQQRRFKEHKTMLDSLKKGDKVLTAGGLIGAVDSIDSEKGEVVVDLGNGLKVTALRSSIQTRIDPKPANDTGKAAA